MSPGAAPPQDIAPFATPSSFTPDGRLAAAVFRTRRDGGEGPDVHVLAIRRGKAREEPLLQTPHAERWPEFSPRGDWLAFGSDLTGRDEIYVQPYPGTGGAVAVRSAAAPARPGTRTGGSSSTTGRPIAAAGAA